MQVTRKADHPARRRFLRRVPARAAAPAVGPLTGVTTAFFAFSAGGFFPGPVGIVAVVLSLAMLIRITVAEHPVAGWGRLAAVAGGAGALYASWILVSATWSHAAARAILEFDRALAYVLLLGLCATVARRPGALSAVLRWALLGMVAAATAGLASRILPHLVHHAPGRDAGRLAYPLSYWNALGAMCAVGAVLAVHAASGRDEPAWTRVAASAALPLLVCAGYFTFSRGAIVMAILGLLAYAILAHPRGLAFTLASAGPPVAVALHAAYGAGALATSAYASGDGPRQGRHVAVVVVGAVLVAAALRAALLVTERRVAGVSLEGRRRRVVLAGLLAAAVVIALAGAVAVDAPGRLRAELHGFVAANVVQETADARRRLGQASNNGRIDIWKVDLDAFRASPLHGTGAGTFKLDWQRARTSDRPITDGHSLYLENLAELGVVGCALLLLMLGSIVVAWARGLRGPERHAHAAALAAGAVLLLHAGIDWDWEMPALFAWFFAAGGVALARPPHLARQETPGRLPRMLTGLACLVLAVTPALAARSQWALDRAVRAFARGDCAAAIDAGLDARDALPVRPEPYELIGYCDLRAGAGDLALRAMTAAHDRDPGAWQYAYGLGVARALTGRDPRAALALAVHANPHEPIARALARATRSDRPAVWARAAARARIPEE